VASSAPEPAASVDLNATSRASSSDQQPGIAAEGASAPPALQSEMQEKLILVIGAAGAKEYEGEFESWADQWQQLAQRHDWQVDRIHRGQSAGPKEELQSAIASSLDVDRLWIVFLGHGTFAKNAAKFNLEGPDVSASELKSWLAPLESQIIFVNCSSASAPFLTELAAENRVVITATQSGSEYNFSRFGKYLSQAINDPSIDLDHDQEISLLEAFLAASKATERFYRDEARLATEHALLNDNGDRVGTSSDFYRGVRPVKESESGEIDGETASRIIMLHSPDIAAFPPELDEQRTAIEQQIDQLRARKTLLSEDDYFNQLEALLLQLAQLYDQAEQ
jgi:hypothetical protein